MTLAQRTIFAAVLAASTGCANGHGLDSTRSGARCGPEVRVCPDGTAVGRIGNRCEWQACPVTTAPPTDESGETKPAAPTLPDGNQPPFGMPR